MLEKQYLKEQKENILDFWREMFNIWEITKDKLQEVYFYNFIKLWK